MSDSHDPHNGSHHAVKKSLVGHRHVHGHFSAIEDHGDEDCDSNGEISGNLDVDVDSEPYEDEIQEEIAHYEAVIGAYGFYEYASQLQFNRLERQFALIPERHQELFQRNISETNSYLPPLERISKLHEASKANAHFIDVVLSTCDDFLNNVSPATPAEILSRPVQPKAPSKNPLSGFNADKVQSTLCQLAREWSAEGEKERLQTFQPILDALTRLLPVTNENRYQCTSHSYLQRDASEQNLLVKWHQGEASLLPVNWRFFHFPVSILSNQCRFSLISDKVICPGSGLGRLPLDICFRGYYSLANEFSYFMLIMSNFMLNKTSKVDQFTIYPWIHQVSNVRNAEDQLKGVTIPDIAPSTLPKDAQFGCAAGDFLEIAVDQEGEWDAVTTCFFLDTASNVIDYLEAIWRVLKPGGYWINLGPLLYHYANSSQPSLELTLDQIIHAAKAVGFELLEQRPVPCMYTRKRSSMMNVLYDAEFWIAKKPNSVPKEH